MTKTMSVREARDNFSNLLGSVHYTNQPVMIERNGQPWAVVVSPQQYEALRKQEERDWEIIDEVGKRNAHLDTEEEEAYIMSVIKEVRRKMRAEREQSAQGRS